MAQVKSKVTIYKGAVTRLNEAVTRALEQTAEAIRNDVFQRQVMPFGEDEYAADKDAGGNEKKYLKHQGGTLQNHSTFIDAKGAEDGYVSIVSSTPYARRLYYHPEYKFNTLENPNAKGRWLDDYLPGGKKQNYAHQTFAKFMKKEAGM